MQSEDKRFKLGDCPWTNELRFVIEKRADRTRMSKEDRKIAEVQTTTRLLGRREVSDDGFHDQDCAQHGFYINSVALCLIALLSQKLWQELKVVEILLRTCTRTNAE